MKTEQHSTLWNRKRLFRRYLRIVLAVLGIVSVLAILRSTTRDSRQVNSPIAKETNHTITVGYFANVTHLTALVGVQEHIFEKYFATSNVQVEFVVFSSGSAAIEAMKAGAIDAAYVGPGPALMGYASTGGHLLRIVAGATINGAQLVVGKSINSFADLKGKTIATPQLANTQDIAARTFLRSLGFTTNIWGEGDVKIAPTENAATLELLKSGEIDGAWVPEPWASRLVLEAGAKVLLDEKNIWPNQQFSSTVLVVASRFLQKFPDSVRILLRAHIAINAFVSDSKNAATVKDAVQKELLAKTGKTLSSKVIDRALSNVKVSNDPMVKAVLTNARNALSFGLLRKPNSGFNEIYDVKMLNEILHIENKKFENYTVEGLEIR